MTTTKNITATTLERTSNSSLSFKQRRSARVLQENLWQQYNAESKYYKNMVKSLEKLAYLAFPSDQFNCNAYQEAIVKSLTETISPEIGVKDFWKAIGEANCQTLRIIEGHLNFFNNKDQKIDITSYTQPIVFEAHSSFYKERLLEREERILQARLQLQELLKEIHRR